MKSFSVSLRELWLLLKEAFFEWNKDNASLLAAALAYYAIFSLAPLLIIIIALTGLLLGPQASAGIIEKRLGMYLGPQIALILQDVITKAANSSMSIFATGAASVFLFFGATGLFLQTKRGLNIIWGVRPRHGAVINLVKSYALSFIQLLVTGFVILVSTILTALLSSAGRYFRGLLHINFGMLHVINFSVFFIMAFILFALTYKTLSGVCLLWRDIIYGSALTALFFVVGNILIELYVSALDLGSIYGAASSIVVVLLWVYYSSQIFFFGAEFIKVYARTRGSLCKKN
jgi:membrane protein